MKKTKIRLNENILRTMIRESLTNILNEIDGADGNYPLGADNDPDAPWNQKDDEYDMETVTGKAYFYQMNNDEDDAEDIVEPFEVEIPSHMMYDPYGAVEYSGALNDIIDDMRQNGYDLNYIEID